MKIGTRGSKLALIQTQKVVDVIKAAHPDISIEIVTIQTSGDWKPAHGETLLSAAAGGKGLFAKEIELALLDGRIDLAMHCLKDVETFMDERLTIQHVLDRSDPRDAFISNTAQSIDDLPQGAVVGTSSARRGAILLSHRPDLKIVPFRGNVDTRLKKLDEGQVDATILAVAGLDHMEIQDRITSYLDPETMLPAVCQGVTSIQARADDTKTLELLDAINHEPTYLRAMAERAVLSVLDGSCRTPIGSYAEWKDDHTLYLRALVAELDGHAVYKHEETATVTTLKEARSLGTRVGEALKIQTPQQCLAVNG